MTDQQNYTDPYGAEMTLYSDPVREDVLDISAPYSVVIPTARLLAMIDRAAPDAMRAYLRETAPEVIADLYRPEIPEADSPEDIDERVPPREALLTDAQERRLYLIEQLTKTLPADETPALAHWIITGGMDMIEDLTLSGESLNR